MNSSEFNLLEEVFDAAIDLPPDERREYLEDACGNDTKLIEHVERMLAHAEQSMSVFSRQRLMGSACGESGATLAAEMMKPGENIGPYSIVRQIGEGGFGSVYFAQQESPIRRPVALKIIKPGMDSRQVIARFEAERQALALMDHPNVARVFDAGATEKGRPYFVMEYVAGIPITEHCDKQRLGIEQRLALFMRVCDAVQHAHQKGIIHRDIKPSNVLVTIQDDKAVPKVIDFGVAKATQQKLTEQTLFTELGQLIGTPEYMSPEQAEMTAQDVDTRSDIYSLGVLLYELLTGCLPFDSESLRKAGFAEIQRIIREVDPPTPSSRLSTLTSGKEGQLRASILAKSRQVDPRNLLRDLRGDLDWIVMKCLEKDRARRYESANGLVMDLQRHLNNEPVMASPPSAVYRVRKFMRRNKVVVTAGSLIAAALVFGLTLATVGFVRAVDAEKVVTVERDRALLAEEKAKLLRRLFSGGKMSLVVLPLANASGDPEQEYFVDGVTEALITDLSRLSSLRVISMASALLYKNTERPLSEIANELKVDAIVLGSVERTNGTVRIDVQLMHAGTNKTLWEDRYEGPWENVVSLQAQISRDVTSEIELQLTPTEASRLAQTPEVEPKAYEAYLKGRHLFNQQTQPALMKSLEFFDEAIELQPDYALAYAAKAMSLLAGQIFYWPTLEAAPQAKEAVLKALEIDPELAEAHVALGYIQLGFEWKWQEAEQSFLKALELNPSLADAHVGYAHHLACMLRPDEAVAELERAIELDPVSMISGGYFLWTAVITRRYELVNEYLDRADELYPDHFVVTFARSHVYTILGEDEKAIEAIDHLWIPEHSPLIIGASLAGFYAAGGKSTEARELVDVLLQLAKDRYVCPYEIGVIYVALGELDKAFEYFEEAYVIQSECIVYLNTDARLDGIRTDPRFIDLLKRVGHQIPDPPPSTPHKNGWVGRS